MKTCTVCKEELPKDDFNKKGKGLQPYCKACQKIKRKQYYEQNKAYYKIKNASDRAKRKEANYEYLFAYFQAHPCVDCGEDDPLVLECDHLSDKDQAVSACMSNWSLARLKKEIAKCEIRCANCHKRKTAIELGFARSQWIE